MSSLRFTVLPAEAGGPERSARTRSTNGERIQCPTKIAVGSRQKRHLVPNGAPNPVAALHAEAERGPFLLHT